LTLFDPSPKSSARDLFGRDKELQDLEEHLEKKRWVVLLGPRRIGKTSLARCALSKLSIKNVIVDARQESDLVRAITESILPISRLSGLQIGGGFQGATATLGIARESVSKSLSKLLDSAGRLVILIDEAQWLRNPKGVSRLLAHIYDYHYSKITLLVTGSAVGVMKSILEPTAKSPFYGRAISTMELQRWGQSTSLSFLKKGCDQAKIEFDERELSNVVEKLDGIPGWLTLFGYYYSTDPKRDSAKAVKKTVSEAMKILRDELESVSKISPLGWQRQLKILKQLSSGPQRFSNLGTELGINNTALSHNLDMLHRLRYVAKQDDGEYAIVDPLVSEFIASQTIR
jgi:uncharacterized protein